MARRRKIILRWYFPDDLRNDWEPQANSAWYRCDKWNLDCTCRICKYSRQFIGEQKRRAQLKRDIIDNLSSWE
jgi:hypothetical protein